MKWVLLLILLISCESEDMRFFVSSINTTPTTDTGGFSETTLKIAQLGQSLSVGEYGLSSAGFSNDKIFQTNARYLSTKGYRDLGTIEPFWKTFDDYFMSPYLGQPYTAEPVGLPVYGVAGQYTIAELLKANHNLNFDIFMGGKGATAFGTDAAPRGLYISADGLTLSGIARDTKRTLTWMAANGLELHGINWMHGESDARDDNASLVGYDTMCLRFFNMIRDIYPDVPFFVRIMPEEARAWIENPAAGGTVGGLDIINAKLQTVISTIGNAYPVYMPVPHSLEYVGGVHESVPVGSTAMATAFYNKYVEIFDLR